MLHTDTKEIEETNNNIAERSQALSDEIKNKQAELNGVGKDEEKTEPVEVEEEMSLLSSLKQKTDKDIDGSANGSGNALPDVGLQKDVNGNPVRKTNIIYQNHEIVAKMTVACLNVAMGLLLQFISDDWSEEAEKKYSLSQTRKNEILEPLTVILEQKRGKYNPVVILVITVLVAYIPMFVTAFRTRKEKLKLKGKKKVLNTGKIDEASEDTEEALKSEINDAAKVQIKEVEIFKMTKGQRDRLKKIKSKRGARSEEDKNFIKEMGLEGFI